jgi:maleylpyruvate isomerase
MTHTVGTRDWADEGTRLLLKNLERLTDAEVDGPCALPGWTRRQLLAHVASNAEAIGRLLTWARTGIETPMYSSPQQRMADIEAGARRADLRDWVHHSAADLAQSMDSLTCEAWSAEVVTAQGRIVPASETPWMRARETCIHAVDLGAGTTFADLPEGFLVALLNDVAAWRSIRTGPAILLTTPHTRHEIAGDGQAVQVNLPLSVAAAWLVGRHSDSDLPTLRPWL